MTKLEREARNMAMSLCSTFNPYIEESTEYFIGHEPMYIYKDGKTYTRAALNDEYIKTASKDFICGYNDRRAGYYDKWYRYNHADNGRAYDTGSRYACDNYNVPEMHIIPA